MAKPQISDYEVIFDDHQAGDACKLCDMYSLEEAQAFAEKLAKAQGFRGPLVRPIPTRLPQVQAPQPTKTGASS